LKYSSRFPEFLPYNSLAFNRFCHYRQIKLIKPVISARAQALIQTMRGKIRLSKGLLGRNAY